MKTEAILSGVIAGLIFMVLLPILCIMLNNYLGFVSITSIIFLILGLLLVIIGIVIFIHCSMLFVRFGDGTPAPMYPPKKLVARGIYLSSRNPIYLGYLSILFGEYLIFGHLLLFFYAVLVFSFICYYVIKIEEPKLKERFGKSYELYCRSVPRWL